MTYCRIVRTMMQTMAQARKTITLKTRLPAGCLYLRGKEGGKEGRREGGKVMRCVGVEGGGGPGSNSGTSGDATERKWSRRTSTGKSVRWRWYSRRSPARDAVIALPLLARELLGHRLGRKLRGPGTLSPDSPVDAARTYPT